MLRRQKPHAIDGSSSLERDVLASDAPRKASSPAGVDTIWGGSESTVVAVRNRAHSFVADHAGRVFSTRSTVDRSWRRRLRADPLYTYSSFMYTLLGLQMLAQSLYCAAATPHFSDEIAVAEAAWVIISGFISYWSDTHMLCLPSIAVWKSTSASGAPDNSSLSHFSAMTRPPLLGRAARNRHLHAVEQASRRWRGGRCDDSARTRRKI